MKRIIYADNAATTRLDPDALNAMVPFLADEYGNPSQPYAFSRKPKMAIREARELIASCIGAYPEEIFFTSGGTESDNWAIKGVSFNNSQKKATITSAFEHHAILHACDSIEKLGYPVSYLQPSHEGYISEENLACVTKYNPALVSIMFANNEIGTVQPISQLCSQAHKMGALFHTDAVQVIGHLPVNVHKLDVDLLSASAHKFNGPKGVGFLYIKKGVKIHSYADGGAQEHGMRAGTENVAGIVGMAAALSKNCSNMIDNSKRVKLLESILIDALNSSGIEYIRNGGSVRLPGLISLSFPGADGEAILHRLDLKGICVSTGSACNSRLTEVSHVLRAIGLDELYAKGTIRISLSSLNNEDDVVEISKAIEQIFC